ncbi:MAG TPA: alkaline phosphatase family protein [Polyangia bacterium]
MRCHVFLGSLVFLFLGASAFNAKTRPEERNAILISWDGALREHVRGDLARGKLPNLARLIRLGALVDLDVTGHQTDTKAGHAQMLTGYDPALTGVYANGKFNPIPSGTSIFERLHQALGKHGITTIMLTGKDHNLGSRAPGLFSHGEPYHLVRPGITVWDGDEMRRADVVGEKAVSYIRDYAKQGRFFLFIHFPDIDLNGHSYGEDSDAYDSAMVECDRWLGKIMTELENQGIDGRTLVYVSADHGFEVGTKNHRNAPHIFLATSDPSVSQAGQQRDITPTILRAMGVDLAKISPALPGRPLGK